MVKKLEKEIDKNINVHLKNSLFNKVHFQLIEEIDKKWKLYLKFVDGGSVLMEKNQLNESIKFFDKAIQLKINDIEAFYLKAKSLMLLNKFDKVEPILDSALAIDQKSPKLLELKGSLLYKQGSYKSAIEFYDKSIQLDQSNARPYLNIGLSLIKLDQTKRAINFLEKAIQINPKYVRAFVELGNIFNEEIKDYFSALKVFNKALEIESNNPDAQYGKCKAFFKLNKCDLALEICLKTLLLHKNQQIVLKYIGICHYFLGNPKDAIEMFNRYKIETPGNFFVKGLAHYELKNYQNALECFENAIKLDQKNYNYAYNKGVVLFRLKRYREAISFILKAVELYFNSSDNVLARLFGRIFGYFTN